MTKKACEGLTAVRKFLIINGLSSKAEHAKSGILTGSSSLSLVNHLTKSNKYKSKEKEVGTDCKMAGRNTGGDLSVGC